MTTTSETGTGVRSSPRSLPARVVGVILSPGELFEEFRERTPWAGPLLLAMALGIAVVLLIPSELYVAQMREELRRSGAVAAEIDAAEAMAGFAPLLAVGAIVVGQPLVALVVAGALRIVFSTFLGGTARYEQYLAVVTHSMLILTLGSLIALPLRLLTRDASLHLSPALLVPSADPDSALAGILGALDVFGVWTIVVMGLGVHVLDRRTSWALATAILLGTYLALAVGFALIG